uniref:Ribosomal protein L18 n=1 Tax=Lotharella vacuolata TaxID=74820 RepID=A0A0H5BHB6_9EUKA|nr:ribosomal protein L18 [Lotharella vacuolata]
MFLMTKFTSTKSCIQKKNNKNLNLLKKSKKFLIFNKKINQIYLYLNFLMLENVNKKNIIIFKDLQNYIKVNNKKKSLINKTLIYPGIVIGPIDYKCHTPIKLSSFKISKSVVSYIVKVYKNNYQNSGEYNKLEHSFIYKKNFKDLKLIKKL